MSSGIKRQSPTVTVISALIFVSLPFVLAAAGVGWLVYGAMAGLGITPSVIGWLVAVPVLYMAGLLLMLSVCALEVRIWQRFLGYRKPARVHESDRRAFYMVMLWYMRQRIVWKMPFAQSFLAVDGLRILVLSAAAPRVTLGFRSFLFGYLYDPDLTEIGEEVILGAESFIVCHSITTNPDGSRLYVSAPVTIGPRSVIGGQSRIDLGVRMGADAMVEPMSYVSPFTVIGSGEVWGGNPARFVRMRFEATEPIANSLPAPLESATGATEQAVREILATVLDLPLDHVTGDLTTSSCAAWDSMAQLAIGVSLQQTFGITVTAEESFRLRSMADLRKLVEREPSLVTAAASVQTAPAPVLPSDPELLPLMDHELVTSGLAAGAGQRSEIFELSVVVAATFTAEPLATSLRLWSRAFGVSTAIEFAGYNQLPQTLLSPDSPFGRNPTGLNLVLARPEDLLSGPEHTREQALRDVLDAIAQFAERSPGTLVVGTLPPAVSPFFNLDRKSVEQHRVQWQSRLEQIHGIELLDFAAVVERLGIDASRSTDMEVVARAPYSAAAYRELGIEIARNIRRRVKAQAKVLALDADGVLWGGVIGEDGIDGVQLGPDHPGRAFQLFQQQVLELKQRGILLVLVSRNAEADVWQMLDRHPGMKLRRSDFAASRINWQPKSQNLRELAAELNLGLDAFVFVDDDRANRLEVETNAPGVVVVPLPTEAAEYCQTLSRLWCFDATTVTAEDLGRTEMIQQEQLRQEGQASAGGMASYLASLELVVEMRLAEAADLPRVAQLTQKTNQFNLSLKRRSLPEIQALAREARVFVVSARDRFGDYGLIGVCIITSSGVQPRQFEFDTFLMSCRALGRGIEDAVLFGVRTAVEAEGATRLLAPFVEGPRNQPIREFLVRTGFQEGPSGVFELDELNAVKRPAHVAFTSHDLHADLEMR